MHYLVVRDVVAHVQHFVISELVALQKIVESIDFVGTACHYVVDVAAKGFHAVVDAQRRGSRQNCGDVAFLFGILQCKSVLDIACTHSLAVGESPYRAVGHNTIEIKHKGFYVV